MFGGAAGYRPRVRSAYYERVYVHSPRGDRVNIGSRARFAKGRVSYVLYEVYAGFVRKSGGAREFASMVDANRDFRAELPEF